MLSISLLRMDSLDSNSLSMKPLDPENFSKECSTVLNFIAEYYRNIEKYSVRSEVEPGYLSKVMLDTPPYFPESLETILEEITAKIVPGLTHWQSPGFFAYFPATTSTAGFVGEMLCNGFNTVGFNWITSPAATELESIVMDWFGKMLQLPTFFLFSEGQGGGGVLHGSTTESAICTLVAARDRALKKIGSHESIAKLVVYASDQTHFAIYKAAKIIGIPCANLRVISTYASSEYSLNAIDVRSAIEVDVANGLIPLYLCATIGTTAIGAADCLVKLGQVAKDYGIWFHVDAAYAGSACICPEFRHYLNGIELADSLCISAHKWLLTGLDCTCLWVKNSSLLTESLSINPEYLRNKASEMKQVVDYKDWQLALSRRFRALKLWMVIQRYGVLNLMQHIRSDVAMAKHFEIMVRLDERFEVVVPSKFSLVCFRVNSGSDEDNRRVMDEVNCSGKVFVTHAVLDGVFVIRFAVGGTLTEFRHVDDAWELIRRKADDVLGYAAPKTWSTSNR